MAENRDYLSQTEENGAIHIAEEVVAAIVADAVGEVEGVGPISQSVSEQLPGKKTLRGVRITESEGAIVIDVYLMLRYGFAIPDTAQKVQEGVSGAVSGMTGFPVKAVNVHVGGISFSD